MTVVALTSFLNEIPDSEGPDVDWVSIEDSPHKLPSALSFGSVLTWLNGQFDLRTGGKVYPIMKSNHSVFQNPSSFNHANHLLNPYNMGEYGPRASLINVARPSHALAFTQILNDRESPEHVPGARVVAAYPGGVGFVFKPYHADALVGALQRAVASYRDPARWLAIMRRGMARDFSWGASARKYLDLYRGALERRS